MQLLWRRLAATLIVTIMAIAGGAPAFAQNTGVHDTGAQNTNAQNTGAQNTGAQNTVAPPAGAPAMAGMDAGGNPSTPGGVVMLPHDWQIDMQTAHSPVKQHIHDLNAVVSGLMVLVVVFVAVLMAYTLWRFNHRRHPVPSRVSHHTWLEVAWTVTPALILLVIFIPTMRLIYYEDRTQNADMTLKVTGHQWYWQYTYPDSGNLHFDSYILPDDQLKPGQHRLLDVDNQLVLPVGKNIRILTTSADVIHSFFIPSLGVQRYAIPGRIIETWVRIDKPGVYYGECNQICGTNHSRMPIAVHAVTPDAFQAWLQQAKTRFADADGPAMTGARIAASR